MSDMLTLRGIECRYDDRVVVDDLSMRVKQGGLVCLLGPSGCGKTTVLRAIAGFQELAAGEIVLHDRVVSRNGYTLPPEKRRVGMVFQDYALFPHLSIADNVGFGLRELSGAAKRARINATLETVGLSALAERYPHELSGGQQQRVALARALAPAPDLILMDEPFSSLDTDMRERLSEEVRGILKKYGATAVMVTHDQHEAFAMSDNVGVMQHGRIAQWDTPYNLYHEPNSRFVADFIGQGVLLEGTLLAPDSIETEVGVLKGNRAYDWGVGAPVEVLLRPDDIVPDPNGGLYAEVIQKAFKGAEILYTLRLPTGRRVLSLFPSHADHGIGERVSVRVEADHLVAFRR